MTVHASVVPVGLGVNSRYVGTDLVLIAAVTTTPMAVCPVCHTHSSHVQSRNLRTVADLPSHGRRVVWRVTARRLRCRTAGCSRTVFCERLPAIRSHACATDPLVRAQRDVALAVGGEAGSRLCRRLTLPTSGDTLLRRIRAIPPAAAPTLRVLGVDDFAFRRWPPPTGRPRPISGDSIRTDTPLLASVPRQIQGRALADYPPHRGIRPSP
ncbi:MAG: transposase family protein [Fimbriiglobus sp.]|nr:transposase family protein [Fimbriiglobus sp.]